MTAIYSDKVEPTKVRSDSLATIHLEYLIDPIDPAFVTQRRKSFKYYPNADSHLKHSTVQQINDNWFDIEKNFSPSLDSKEEHLFQRNYIFAKEPWFNSKNRINAWLAERGKTLSASQTQRLKHLIHWIFHPLDLFFTQQKHNDKIGL